MRSESKKAEGKSKKLWVKELSVESDWQWKVGLMEISYKQHSPLNDQFLAQGKTEGRRKELWVKGLGVMR